MQLKLRSTVTAVSDKCCGEEHESAVGTPGFVFPVESRKLTQEATLSGQLKFVRADKRVGLGEGIPDG